MHQEFVWLDDGSYSAGDYSSMTLRWERDARSYLDLIWIVL